MIRRRSINLLSLLAELQVQNGALKTTWFVEKLIKLPCARVESDDSCYTLRRPPKRTSVDQSPKWPDFYRLAQTFRSKSHHRDLILIRNFLLKMTLPSRSIMGANKLEVRWTPCSTRALLIGPVYFNMCLGPVTFFSSVLIATWFPSSFFSFFTGTRPGWLWGRLLPE